MTFTALYYYRSILPRHASMPPEVLSGKRLNSPRSCRWWTYTDVAVTVVTWHYNFAFEIRWNYHRFVMLVANRALYIGRSKWSKVLPRNFLPTHKLFGKYRFGSETWLPKIQLAALSLINRFHPNELIHDRRSIINGCLSCAIVMTGILVKFLLTVIISRILLSYYWW